MANLRNFIITFCVCLLLFGFTAAKLMTDLSDGEQSSNTPAIPTITTPEKSDDIVEFGDGKDVADDLVGQTFSVLISVFDNSNENIKYMSILKADKESKNYLFLSIPMNMLVPVDDVDTKLSDITKYYDLEFLYKKIYAITGLETDYRISITESNLSTLVDTLGGITYDIPFDMLEYNADNQTIPSVNIKKGKQKLGGKKVLQLLKFSKYENNIVYESGVAQTGVLKAIVSLIATEQLDFVRNNSSTIFNLMKTDLPETFFDDNHGILSGYSSFIKTESQYPGYEDNLVNDGLVFVPYIDEATSKFRQFR